jgi:uncharacterized protein YdaU (DUF1376 family)
MGPRRAIRPPGRRPRSNRHATPWKAPCGLPGGFPGPLRKKSVDQEVGPMAAPLPYMEFWVVDWLADEFVTRMTLEQRGAYIHLLCHQWVESSVPTDVNAICDLLGCDGRSKNRMLKTILPVVGWHFEPIDGNPNRSRNKRLHQIREKALAWVETRRRCGKTRRHREAKAKLELGSSRAEAKLTGYGYDDDLTLKVRSHSVAAVPAACGARLPPCGGFAPPAGGEAVEDPPPEVREKLEAASKRAAGAKARRRALS